MAKGIDEIKLNKYIALRKGLMPKSRALKGAGYATSTANDRCGDLPSVKIGEEIIRQELKMENLNAGYFINKREMILKKALSLKRPDLTNALRAQEGQERLAGVDNTPSTVINAYQISTDADVDMLTAAILRRQTKEKTL